MASLSYISLLQSLFKLEIEAMALKFNGFALSQLEGVEPNQARAEYINHIYGLAYRYEDHRNKAMTKGYSLVYLDDVRNRLANYWPIVFPKGIRIANQFRFTGYCEICEDMMLHCSSHA